MTVLNLQFHPCAEAEFDVMVNSGVEDEEDAAAQLLWTLELFRTSLPIYRALYAVNENVQFLDQPSSEFISLRMF